MHYALTIDAHPLEAACEPEGPDQWRFLIDDQDYRVSVLSVTDHHLHLVVNGRAFNVFIAPDGRGESIGLDGVTHRVADAEDPDGASLPEDPGKKRRDITPPMPSVVVRTMVKEGDRVAEGQGLIVVSAMKMETTLTAPFDGRVVRIAVTAGDQVTVGQILANLEPLSGKEEK